MNWKDWKSLTEHRMYTHAHNIDKKKILNCVVSELCVYHTLVAMDLCTADNTREGREMVQRNDYQRKPRADVGALSVGLTQLP